jgi:hypothetical protein
MSDFQDRSPVPGHGRSKTMSKDATTKTQTSRSGHESSAGPNTERPAKPTNLIEIKPGLFLNVDQIVSLRVLPQEEGSAYALLQLSNGDKLSLTRGEFSTISGEEPRPLARLPQKPLAE